MIRRDDDDMSGGWLAYVLAHVARALGVEHDEDPPETADPGGDGFQAFTARARARHRGHR